MTEARDELIEAMALSDARFDGRVRENLSELGRVDRERYRARCEASLSKAIAEQGYAVVPRDRPDDAAADACGLLMACEAIQQGRWAEWKRAFYRAMVAAADVARPETPAAGPVAEALR